MVDVHELVVEVPRREVLRYMGYPRTHSPSSGVASRVDQAWEQACALLRPRGAWVLATRADAEAIGMPDPSPQVAFGVCSIGPALEELEVQWSGQGDVLGGLILDAFGSAAAEVAAEALHARVCAGVQPAALYASRRLSPGYGRWNVTRQRELLAHLPIDRLGIRLTEGSMMIPRKSVSFAVILGETQTRERRARCASCELETCRFRVDDDAGPQEKKET
ncbi:MAG: hypothetical protein HY898_36850 [Deltaproteobacteria bacterium]|nr:hypothetical protein [Deltaproteobacteria bacterium]